MVVGWMYVHKPYKGNIKQFLTDEVFVSERLLDVAVVNFNEAYFAFKNGTEVRGGVVLLRFAPKQHNNFGYKVILETDGPTKTNCPARILKQLTDPPLNEYAEAWREACWRTKKGW